MIDVAARGRRRLPGAHRDGRERARPVRARHRADGRPAGRRRASTRRTDCSTCDRAVRSTSSRSSPTTSSRCASRCSAGRSSAARSGVGVHDLRRWTDDVHRTVDDTPYGGGPGMVMLPEPWGRALWTRSHPPEARSRGWSCRHPPAGRSPRRSPPNSPPSRGCCSRAAATRASTRGCRVRGHAHARRRDQPRRLRAGRRRGRRAGHRRGGRPAAARRARQRRSRRADDSFADRTGRPARGPGLHQAGDLARLDVPPVLLSGQPRRGSREWRAERSRNAPRSAVRTCWTSRLRVVRSRKGPDLCAGFPSGAGLWHHRTVARRHDDRCALSVPGDHELAGGNFNRVDRGGRCARCPAGQLLADQGKLQKKKRSAAVCRPTVRTPSFRSWSRYT